MRVALGLLVLTAVSVALRTGALDAGYWIDEAIAVGIASHELLRRDRAVVGTTASLRGAGTSGIRDDV